MTNVLNIDRRPVPLTVLAAATLGCLASPASAQVIEAAQSMGKGANSGISLPEIVVSGRGNDNYDRVETPVFDAWITVRAPDEPDRAQGRKAGTIEAYGEERVRYLPRGFSTSADVFKIPVTYRDLYSSSVPGGRTSAVQVCNDYLAGSAPANRAEAREKGFEIIQPNAVMVRATQNWHVRGAWTLERELVPYHSDVHLKVRIVCRPLAGPKARQPGTTTTAGKRPVGQKMEPTIRVAALRALPQRWAPVDGMNCPTEVKLRGLVGTRRSFDGVVRFSGPAWTGPMTPVRIDGAGDQAAEALFMIDWSKRPGRRLGANSGRRAWTMDFAMEILSDNRERIESTTKEVEVACVPA